MADIHDDVDQMVWQKYDFRRGPSGYLIAREPLAGSVITWIEERTEVEHDRYLLSHFDALRRDYLTLGEPVGVNRACMRRLDGTYQSLAHQQPHDIVIGEIPWRCFHDDRFWKLCHECNHPEFLHAEYNGYSGCSHGEYVDGDGWLCSPCNCGNNIGR